MVVPDSARCMKLPVWKLLEPSAYIYPCSARMLDSSVWLTWIFNAGVSKLTPEKRLGFKGDFSQTPHVRG